MYYENTLVMPMAELHDNEKGIPFSLALLLFLLSLGTDLTKERTSFGVPKPKRGIS